MKKIINKRYIKNDKLETFKDKLKMHIKPIQDLIDTLPDKGNKCWESQKVCLQSALIALEYNINGLVEKDLED